MENSLRKPRIENKAGPFYVDTQCIDCGACYELAPETFQEKNEQSAVYQQPKNNLEVEKATQALFSCPTTSIHSTNLTAEERKQIVQSFPLPIADDVYFCGFNSEKSYGAFSYFIRRAEGNILIDSPRFVLSLAKKLQEMGGVKYMILTHQDDVADHDKYQKYFSCERIIHEGDYQKDFGEIENILAGIKDYPVSSDLIIIPTPGHTKGHCVILYKNKFLFTGDHLAWSAEDNKLIALRSWYSRKEQARSVEKLEQYDFEWILPGHGRRFHTSLSSMKNMLHECVEKMKQQS